MNTNENRFKPSYSNKSQGFRNGGYNQGYGVGTENKFSAQNRSVTGKNENGNKRFVKSGTKNTSKPETHRTRTVEIEEQDVEEQVEEQEEQIEEQDECTEEEEDEQYV